MKDTLSIACQDGDLGWFKKQKSAGKLPDLTQAQNFPVDLAVSNGHFELVKWMVSESGQFIDLNAYNGELLKLAAECGELEILEWLVTDSGQSVSFDSIDKSVLQRTARFGHPETTAWLLQKSGVIYDCRDYQTWTYPPAKNCLELIKAAAADQSLVGLEDWAVAFKPVAESRKRL